MILEALAAREARRTALRLFGRALLHRELRIGTLLPNGAPEHIREAKEYLSCKFNKHSLCLTQREIAQLTGYTPETVCKKQPMELCG